MGVVFRNSEFINEQDLVIKCSNRSFSYGDGFFETIKIINKETLSYLEDNTVIGNAARGDVVDDDAMVEAIKNGKVFAYGLDVYNGEPKIHPEYLKLKNIFLLPHLGSATKRTRWDMAYRATKNLVDFFDNKTPQDLIN